MNKGANKGFTLIELLVVIGILTVLLTAVLIAINPVRQFQQARDSQRRNDVLTILNAIQQNMADNKGVFSGPALPGSAADISTGGVNLCAAVSPTYVSILPVDPSVGTPTGGVTACGSAYDTGYFISQTSGRITVSYGAAGTPETPGSSATISVTR